jgi:hypothetical protein
MQVIRDVYIYIYTRKVLNVVYQVIFQFEYGQHSIIMDNQNPFYFQ